MTKVLVLYYSSYGHIEAMARAVAEGAASTGAEVDIKRVPETAPADVVAAAGNAIGRRQPEVGKRGRKPEQRLLASTAFFTSPRHPQRSPLQGRTLTFPV